MFPAVYSDRILTFGRYTFPNPEADAKVPFRMKVGQLFVFGAQLGWLDVTLLDYPTEAAFQKRLCELRQNAQDFLAYGEMLRPLAPREKLPTVTGDWRNIWGGTSSVTLPAVVNGVWKAPDGRIAIFLVNVSLEDQRFAGRLTARDYGLEGRLALLLESLDGQERVEGQSNHRGGYDLDVAVPAGEAKAFVLKEMPLP